MGSKGTAEYRTRSERERQRREKAQRTSREAKPSDPGEAGRSGSKRRRAAVTDCAWCGVPFTPRSRGPIPKWCSATCRHRAWEQRRAAASGRAAVRVVERRVEVAVPLTPTRHDWPQLLAELARQLDDGGRPIGYDRTVYRRRNVIERAFNRLKAWSGIATRYDKHATVFHGAVVLASILIWLRHQETRPCSAVGQGPAEGVRRQ